MKTEAIKDIRKRFSREWLLIAVDAMDDATTTPISGRLVAHSPDRKDVYERLAGLARDKKLLVEYSEDTFPDGFAAAF